MAKDAIYVPEEMARRISVATFWIEGHDGIRTAMNIAIRARATVFGSFWESHEEAGQFTLPILPLRKMPVSNMTSYKVANVSWKSSVEVMKIGRYSKGAVINDGIIHHLLDERARRRHALTIIESAIDRCGDRRLVLRGIKEISPKTIG